MKVGAKELRIKAALILEEVQRGRDVTITYRRQPVAVIRPIDTRKRGRAFTAIGFGLWADREDLGDVSGWIRKIRRPRYVR